MSRSVSNDASASDRSNRTTFHSQNSLSSHSQSHSQSHGHTPPPPIPIAASVPPDYGTTHASGITLLLADHEKFGFSERACYHFDLIETLTQRPQNLLDKVDTNSPPRTGGKQNDKIGTSTGNGTDDGQTKQKHEVPLHEGETIIPIKDESTNSELLPYPTESASCGVVALLECVSMAPMKQTKGKRKRLMKRIKEFNKVAREARRKHFEEKTDYCHQPEKLPLHLSFHTRMAFAYELTRIVFCIDASPTLTSTFGNTGYSDGAICAMDRLEKMVRVFLNGLVEPILGAGIISAGTASADANATMSIGSNNRQWSPEIAVTVMACFPPTVTKEDDAKVNVLVTDFRMTDVKSASQLADRIVEFATMEVENEIASRLGRVGGKLHSSVSSLRHIIEMCDRAMTNLPSRGRPTIVLATDCRAVECDSILDLVRDRNLKDTPLNVLDLSGSHSHRTGASHDVREGPNYLTFDPDGPSSFPLIMPDDSEALHNVCKSTRGYFLDSERLREATTTSAGNVSGASAFNNDVYFSAKRRMIRPNALQWHTLFTLSQCCPQFNSHWGTMPPPSYIDKRRQLVSKQKPGEKTFFFSYDLNPVRAKSIIILRIMDGFRPRRYGTNSIDNDKVSIQFVLNLELGTMLHYEFRYVASPLHSPMVGTAHVKISLSGESSLVHMVKSEYISKQFDNKRQRVMSLKDQACNKIIRFFEWIRHEDQVEAEICPLDWSNDNTEFLQYIGKLEKYQLYRHFRLETFEAVRNYGDDLDCLLRGSEGDNTAERYLINILRSWSTSTIESGRLYLRQLPMSDGNLTNYCVLELVRSELPGIFKIRCHFFEQLDPNVRMASVRSLKHAIASGSRMFFISPLPFSTRIMRNLKEPRCSLSSPAGLKQSEAWELLREPELLSLVAKRRCFFDDFHPLILNGEQTVLFKFVSRSNRLYLVQYHLAMLSDSGVARIFMDREKGFFYSSLFPRLSDFKGSIFSELYQVVKERDKKCARALRSRRNLLYVFEMPNTSTFIKMNHTEDVERLLLYSSRSQRDLRFYDDSFQNANGILEGLTIDFMLVGHLDARVAEISVGGTKSVGGMQQGRWFLIRYDSETLSMLHFPSEQKLFLSGGSDDYYYRTLTFFTVAFADLYYYKADLPEEMNDHSEHDFSYLTNFIEDLGTAHKHHFANAAYTALRSSEPDSNNSFKKIDFTEVLASCIEEKIVDGLMVTNRVTPDNESKLVSLLRKILSPVPGGSPYLYFNGDERKVLAEFESSGMSTYDENSFGESILFGDDSASDVSEASEDSSMVLGDAILISKIEERYLSPLAPLFIFFKLDDEPVSLDEISSISKMCKLSAFITVFQTSRSENMSELQSAVSYCLISQLNSYIAEQTMEKLRFNGDGNAEKAKKYLLQAESVASVTTPVLFYLPKTDSMIDATVTVGSEEGLRPRFQLLSSCLALQKTLEVLETNSGDFFALDIDRHGWCWIKIPDTIGPVSIHVFHQEGIAVAEEVAKKALQVIEEQCHRVNQMLLLDNMHTSRVVSKLLIPAGNVTAAAKNQSHSNKSATFDLPPGYFECPITHEAIYEVHRRCSPSQTLLELENSIFHSLAVSDRRGVFVYKDEEENVFYMRLKANELESHIKFNVYGINKAGASITEQLDRLIKKKLMELCVEKISMSLVLEKSQRIKLTDSDINFVKTFRKKWNRLEQGIQLREVGEFYEFPIAVYDPVSVLLFFRQNMSGSKFFNLLRHSSRSVNEDVAIPLQDDSSIDSSLRDGINFTFDHRDFSLLYNATQFQLDPRFQAVSTLTQQGIEYSRRASTGMALIEFKLLHANKPFGDAQVKDTNVGRIPGREFDPLQLLNSLRFKKLSPKDAMEGDEYALGRIRLSVKIFNTTLEADAIYRWIELTLNQALISWCTERHLERARVGLCSIPIDILSKKDKQSDKMLLISKLCTGLPSLGEILTRCKDLPHPGIKQFDLSGNFPSTRLAILAVSCLEKAILGPVFGKRVGIKDISGLTTIRLSHLPQIVKMRHASSDDNNISISDSLTKSAIFDSPMDSPQYIFVYGLSKETEQIRRQDVQNRKKSKHVAPSSAFLFQKVSVDDYLSDEIQGSLSNALKILMNNNPYIFMRRIAFILTVSRSSISILSYNLNPQLFESISSKLTEIYEDFVKSQVDRQRSQQSRYLALKVPRTSTSKTESQMPAPSKAGQGLNRRSIVDANKSAVASIPEGREPTSVPSTHKRKIIRPTIVGKSVKGSAAQAMIQNRARARTTRPAPAKVISGSAQRHQTQRSQKVSTIYQTEKKDKNKKKTQESLIFLSPSLLKEFLTLQSFLNSYSLRRSDTINLHHAMFCNWFSSLNGKELPLRTVEFILGHASAVRTIIFPLVQIAVSNPISFLQYFAQSAFANTPHSIIAKNFVWGESKDSIGSVWPIIYVMKKVLSSKRFNLYVVHELSIENMKGEIGKFGRCRSWTFTASKTNIKPWIKEPNGRMISSSQRKKFSHLRREHETIKVRNATEMALIVLYPPLKMFMFSLNILRRVATCQVVDEANQVSAPLLLRETMSLYPTHIQTKNGIGAWYRLLHRQVVWEKGSTGAYSIDTLLKQLISDTSIYGHNISNCTKGEFCISGHVPCDFEDTHFFLCVNKRRTDESVDLDLFVLCCTRGETLEKVVFEDGSPLAKILSSHLLDIAVSTIRGLFKVAADDLNREHLWKKLGKSDRGLTRAKEDKRHMECSREEMNDLLKLSIQHPLSSLDPRLAEVFVDEVRELNLKTSDLMEYFTQDSCVHHYFVLDASEGRDKAYLFYMDKQQIFLHVAIDNVERLVSSKFVGRQRSFDQTNAAKPNYLEAAERFAVATLSWIWDST